MSFASFQLDSSAFEKQMKALARVSTRTDEEIITLNARDILRSIAFNSPRKTGNMNRGWVPAWDALGATGTPNTGSRKSTKSQARRYVAEGSFVDGRKASVKFFEFSNSSHYIRKNGVKYRYPVAVATRLGFMRKAEAEVARKFENRLQKQYQKAMRG
jgi:hypothetical protein